MRRATREEIRYSCLRFHYARKVPAVAYGYSFFLDEEDGGDFVGTVLFGHGASPHLGDAHGLAHGQVLELVRVALNGKQGHGHTSEVVMMAVRQLHRDAPLVRLLVSFADEDQRHVGKIYQATNWVFVGETETGKANYFVINGKRYHNKTIFDRFAGMGGLSYVREHIDPGATEERTLGKLKYLYPLDKAMRRKVLKLARPYPRECRETLGDGGGEASVGRPAQQEREREAQAEG